MNRYGCQEWLRNWEMADGAPSNITIGGTASARRSFARSTCAQAVRQELNCGDHGEQSPLTC